MSPRVISLIVGAMVVGIVSMRPAVAQCGSGSYPAANGYAYQRDLGGEIYYYDSAGAPLYYDDYIHYSYPRRYVYSNGGWILLSSGRGYYGRHAGGAYGAHYRSSYSGYHPSSYSRAHTGYGGGHGATPIGGSHGRRIGGHGHP